MFCPKCGKPDQSPETYCRQCGVFLPDLSKSLKRESPPEEHIKANSFLTVLSGLTSLLMAIWLYTFLERRIDVPPVVNYIVAGLLIANSAWQVQTFIRMRKLRKQLKERGLIPNKGRKSTQTFETEPRMLETADLSEVIHPSVTETTTRKLGAKIPR